MALDAITFERVTKRFGDTVAVADLTLTAAKGEMLALVGHNGAGKTTIFKLILGLVRASAGVVEVLGTPPDDRDGPRRRGTIGFLPETVSFDLAMSGRQALRFYARLKGVGGERIGPLVDAVGLGAAVDRRIGTYSKGMRQRLGLAQALLGEPEILLLDEPTTGLDPAFRHAFYRLVENHKKRGAVIVMATHALTEIEPEADRVAVMNEGRLLAAGPIGTLGQEAGIPARLRVRVRPCATETLLCRLNASVSVEDRQADTLLLSCPATEKLAVLRAVLEAGDIVVDADTLPPSLEELYANLVPVRR